MIFKSGYVWSVRLGYIDWVGLDMLGWLIVSGLVCWDGQVGLVLTDWSCQVGWIWLFLEAWSGKFPFGLVRWICVGKVGLVGYVWSRWVGQVRLVRLG